VKVHVLALALTLTVPPAAAAQEAVFLVRHAERADSSADSTLSDAGRARATRLAEWLRGARITHIYTSELRRTIQTAMPFAVASHLSPQQSAATDSQGLVGRIAGLGPHDRALVVGHSNTIPDIIRGLGVKVPVTIADSEYDNIFLVVPRGNAEPALFRFKY
jgi:broad specificity phosphatase PhoE